MYFRLPCADGDNEGFDLDVAAKSTGDHELREISEDPQCSQQGKIVHAWFC